ncbi:hypothetical protein [Mucilaginibacter sp. CSA2-8R]|uniref:hypothetical protein n=1 Tax=Mucilaginibacter sp. CSA2-8R TaxID=3141542 RepID=UPI00315C87C3
MIDDLNSILSLRRYIEEHLHENGEAWEHQHLPFIIGIVSAFNKSEANFFSQTIWTWPPKVLFELADAILNGGNPHLDENYIYCKIFSLTDDIEDLDYLAQNLGAYFYSAKPQSFDAELLIAIKLKLIQVLDITRDQTWEKNFQDLNKDIDRRLLEIRSSDN